MFSFQDSQLICGNSNISQILRDANCFFKLLLAIRNLIFDKTADFIIHALLALLTKADMHLIGGLADALLQSPVGTLGLLSAGAGRLHFCHRQLLSKFLFIWRYNAPRRYFGAGGVILPEVLPGKEDRGAPL